MDFENKIKIEKQTISKYAEEIHQTFRENTLIENWLIAEEFYKCYIKLNYFVKEFGSRFSDINEFTNHKSVFEIYKCGIKIHSLLYNNWDYMLGTFYQLDENENEYRIKLLYEIHEMLGKLSKYMVKRYEWNNNIIVNGGDNKPDRLPPMRTFGKGSKIELDLHYEPEVY